jgi:hypothetical protein
MCTDPFDADSDDDGLYDGSEDANGSGTVDAGETDPCDPDTDGDGLRDGFEVGAGLDPLTPGDETTDLDGDDLTALEEQDAGTDPNSPDSDGDGIGDGAEVKSTLTDPTEVDTDLDGSPDAGDNCPRDANAGQADADGDGRGDVCDQLNPFDITIEQTRSVLVEIEQSLDVTQIGVVWPATPIVGSYSSSGNLRTILVDGATWEQAILERTTLQIDPGSMSDLVIQLDGTTGDLLVFGFSYETGGSYRIFSADSATTGGWTTNPILPGLQFFCPDPPGGCVQLVPTTTYDPQTGEVAGLGRIELEELLALPQPRDLVYSADLRLSQPPAEVPTLPLPAIGVLVMVLAGAGARAAARTRRRR